MYVGLIIATLADRRPEPFHLEIRFSAKAFQDLIGYSKERQEQILALIVARAKKGRSLRKSNRNI